MENKIVLIEDDEEIREMINDYLSGEFEVTSFNDGMTAIRKLLVDKETRVNYLCWKFGYGAGVTPLLDSERKVIVTK